LYNSFGPWPYPSFLALVSPPFFAMAEEQSKSAKRRAAKKARDAEHGEGAPEAAPAPAPAAAAPKPTPKPKASNGSSEPKAKAKAEAKGKAKAKAEPAPAPAPEAKSKAKAKAKAAAAPAPEPEPKAKAKAGAKAGAKAAAAPAPTPEPPKQAAKAKSEPKSKAKAKAAPVVEEEKKPEKTEIVQPFEMDDGSAGGWEQSTGLTKKAQKRQEKLAMEAAMASQARALPGKSVPGLGPADHIPGMPLRVDQASINATLAAAAAKGAAARNAIEADAKAEKDKESNQSTATVQVPESKIGIVIGPKGSKIKMIQEKTGVTRIDTSGEMFTIMGPPQAVAMAEAAVKELIEKGYCALTFEDFREDSVAVLPTSIPDIVGKGGVVIKAFKSELDVEIKIPEVPKTPPAGKKYKVTIAGKNENVEKAKEVLNSIVMYGYHATTHPDQSHIELDIPDWSYRYLIGKAGSEMRHIQNNYKVKVNIPREHSICQTVVVVGLQNDCERAKTYIEKLIWNAENQTKGRGSGDGAIDTWGDEEDTEDWMKAYMYKR